MYCGKCACGKEQKDNHEDRTAKYPVIEDLADESPILDGEHQ